MDAFYNSILNILVFTLENRKKILFDSRNLQTKICNFQLQKFFVFRLKRQLGVLHFPYLFLSLDQDRNSTLLEFSMQFEDQNSKMPEIFETYHCWSNVPKSTRVKSAWHGTLNYTFGSKDTYEILLLQTAQSAKNLKQRIFSYINRIIES